MMDELELLKKDWQKQESNLPRLSYEEIYRMIWKKSSSLVRWIFYISILEFLLPHLLYILPSFREGLDYEFATQLGINSWLIALTGVQYVVAFYFIFQFYRRYKEISVLDNAQNLIKRIFRTRNTVRNYVIFCLIMILLFFVVFIAGMAMDDNLMATLDMDTAGRDVNPEKFKWITIGVMAAVGIAFTALMGGLYFLLYGLITRKLLKNYRELKRMET